MSEKAWCRSCIRDIIENEDRNAVSLDGWDLEICGECWAKMSPFERISLFKTFGDQSDRGDHRSPADAMTVIAEAVERLFKHHTGHDFFDPCKQCK